MNDAVSSSPQFQAAVAAASNAVQSAAEELQRASGTHERDAAIAKLTAASEALALLGGMDKPAPVTVPSKPEIPIRMRRSLVGALMGEPKRPVKDDGVSWDLYDRLLG